MDTVIKEKTAEAEDLAAVTDKANDTGKDTIIPEFNFSDIYNEPERLLKLQKGNLFISKTANEWIQEAAIRPLPVILFHEFWYEGELCILFGDNGAGKSLLAVQIADDISKKQKVIYIDFELSDKQFQLRYTNDKSSELHEFSENFIRVEFNPDYEPPSEIKFEDYFNSELEQLIRKSGAKVFIIDNITYLRDDYDEKTKVALPLVKYLKKLKKKYELSMLLLAHTPKRDDSRPITVNDLGGSKMLSNFVDSVFCIGKSKKNSNYRYLKQIKIRSGALTYDADNVFIYEIDNCSTFTKFHFRSYGKESEQIAEMTANDKAELEAKIINLHNEHPEYSLRKIASEVGTDHMKAKRIIDKFCNAVKDNT